MECPTVFVVPPNESLYCPLHGGLYEDPVSAPCGCLYCRRCINEALKTNESCPANETHTALLRSEMLIADLDAQERVDELLIHCKHGLRKTAPDTWIPSSSPSACKMWLNLGSRDDHEALCSHKSDEDEDFILVDEVDSMDEFEEFKASDTESDGHPINGDISEPEMSESDEEEEEEEDDEDDYADDDDDDQDDEHDDDESSSSSEYALSASDSEEGVVVMSETRSTDLSQWMEEEEEEEEEESEGEREILVRHCPNNCGAEGMNAYDLARHIIACDREVMSKQINALNATITQKDEEISRLQSLLNEVRQAHPAAHENRENRVSPAPKQDIYIALAKGFTILEEESQRALDDAAATLKKTKAAIQSTDAYQQSMRTISQIKLTFAEVHEDLVAKIASLFEKPEASAQPEETGDSDYDNVLKASEDSFKLDSELRNREEESIQQALRLSLLDQSASTSV